MPIKLEAFGIVATRYDRYIIFLGGRCKELYNLKDPFSDDIFVFNTETLKFRKSNVKCPKKASYYAVITNDIDGDDLLTFGYVNNCYKSPTFNHLQSLSFDVVQLIAKWVCNQTIYLIQDGETEKDGIWDQWESENHWKMDADDILQAI